MFNKKEVSADTPPPETNLAASPKKGSRMSQAPSILSSDLVVTGSVESDGEVQLDGKVHGDVKAGVLTIGEEASVTGEVVAETVSVRGRIEGSLRARQVQLASTARIEGDIIHSTLAIESGAYFDGNCRRESDPLSASTGSSAPKRSAATGSSDVPPAPKPAGGSSNLTSHDGGKGSDPFAQTKASG